MKKRDISVELMRIIASLLVVGVHCSIPFMNPDGNPDFSLTFIAAIVADGVAIFWMISGFFVFRTLDQKKNLIHTLKKIIIPVIGYILFAMFFSGVILKGENFITSIQNGFGGIKNLIYNMLIFDLNDVPYSSHLWYIVVYVLISLILPLFVGYAKTGRKNRYYFLGGMALLLIVNDIMRGMPLLFSHHGLNAMFPAIIIMVIGYELYNQKDIIKKKFHMSNYMAVGVCVVVFLIVCLSRSYLVMNTHSTHYMYWYSCFGIINAICVFYACSCITVKSEGVTRIITYIGQRTFMIYIIHMFVMDILNTYWGLKEQLEIYILRRDGFGSEVLYTIIYAFIVWGGALLVCSICSGAKQLVNRLKRI